MRTLSLFFLSLLAGLLSSCITEDMADNTPTGNFETCWKLIDEHYCFFDYKNKEYGLDWAAVRERYRQGVTDNMRSEQLFEVLRRMTAELRDGHVNLSAAHDVARYGAWFDDFPMNFSDSLARRYLGRSEDFRVGSGLRYRVLSDNVGYIRCSSFNVAIGAGNLHEVMRHFALCDALIVDVRSNGGGQLTSAETLASIFTNRTVTVGYIMHKTGPAHDAFSTPKPVRLSPLKGLRWQKPVAVLINRRTFSAANSFAMYMKTLPGVLLVGDRTGGGSGMPFSSELPGGWSIRFSASPALDVHGEHTEFGIAPDVRAHLSADDRQRGRDSMIETALRALREHHDSLSLEAQRR